MQESSGRSFCHRWLVPGVILSSVFKVGAGATLWGTGGTVTTVVDNRKDWSKL